MKQYIVAGIAGLALFPLGALAATVPAIIPLPLTLQTRPGVFTLCPSQPVPGAPIRATRKIVTDGSSIQTAQYLATTLFRSTGCRFTIVTNGTPGPVRN